MFCQKVWKFCVNNVISGLVNCNTHTPGIVTIHKGHYSETHLWLYYWRLLGQSVCWRPTRRLTGLVLQRPPVLYLLHMPMLSHSPRYMKYIYCKFNTVPLVLYFCCFHQIWLHFNNYFIQKHFEVNWSDISIHVFCVGYGNLVMHI